MLRGASVVLRHAEAGDLDALIRGLNDVRARGDHVPGAMQSPARLRRSFADHGFATEAIETLLITRAADDAVIGTIEHAVTDTRFSEREIGYGIFATEHRGKGYASEAVGLLVDYLFNNFPHQRLRAHADPSNAASIRILEGRGFKREGVLREALLVRGRHRDQAIYGLLRAEWAARTRDAPAA